MNSTRTTAKQWLLSIYPLFRCYRWWIRWVADWKYHALVKRHGIQLYEESPFSALHRDLLAIDLYRALRIENDWMPASLLPVGGAADYKMLYLLGRFLAEYRPREVIEFGAGQSTILLSAYARQSDATVVTVEHELEWARRVANRGLAPSHRLTHCPLTEQGVGKKTCSWYDLSQSGLSEDDRFELIIVDGPIGLPRFSRAGIVEQFSKLHAVDWVVVWDDLHRIGDMQTFVMFLKRLKADGIEHRHVVVDGAKRIGIVYTGKFSGVASYF